MENTQPQAQTMHPVAESIFKFVNDAITLEEAKARTALIESVVSDLHKGIEEFEKAQSAEVSAKDESGAPVEVEAFTEA